MRAGAAAHRRARRRRRSRRGPRVRAASSRRPPARPAGARRRGSTFSRRSCRYSTSVTSSSSVERPGTRRSAARSSRSHCSPSVSDGSWWTHPAAPGRPRRRARPSARSHARARGRLDRSLRRSACAPRSPGLSYPSWFPSVMPVNSSFPWWDRARTAVQTEAALPHRAAPPLRSQACRGTTTSARHRPVAENLRTHSCDARRLRGRGDDRRRRLQPGPHRLGHRRAPGQHASRRRPVGTCSISAADGGRSRSRWRSSRPTRRCGPSTSTSGRSISCDATPTALGLTNVNAVLPDDVPDDVTLPHDPLEPADPGRQARAARPAREVDPAAGRTLATPGSSCSAISAPTRCSAGSRHPSPRATACTAPRPDAGFRVLKVRRHGSPHDRAHRPLPDAAAQASATSPE